MVSSDGWWSENGESVPVLVEIYFIYAVNTCRIAGIPFQSLTVMNTLNEINEFFEVLGSHCLLSCFIGIINQVI